MWNLVGPTYFHGAPEGAQDRERFADLCGRLSCLQLYEKSHADASGSGQLVLAHPLPTACISNKLSICPGVFLDSRSGKLACREQNHNMDFNASSDSFGQGAMASSGNAAYDCYVIATASI
jgi:hypothetical protein